MFFAALLVLRMRTVLNERKAMALRLTAGAVLAPQPEAEPMPSMNTAVR
jgi:hypothetical protein